MRCHLDFSVFKMLILCPLIWLRMSSRSKQVQMSSDEDKLYIKIIALDRILQLYSWKVFELKLFRVPKYCCKCADFEIWNLKLSNNLGCWYGLYESYIYQYDLKTCSWKVFYLKLFSAPNMCSKFIDFEIRNLEHIFEILNDFK
jgi:hypothetical protein